MKLHDIPRTIMVGQAKRPIGHQVKAFCKQKINNPIEAAKHNHRAFVLVIRLKQTIANPLACIKAETQKQGKGFLKIDNLPTTIL